MSVPAARRELAACAGEQFDPAIVRAFLNVSLGRLWWTVGPMSWTALAPILGPVQRAGGQLAAAATGAAAAVVVGVLPLVSGAAGASVGPATARATTGAVADPSLQLDDGVGGRGAGTTVGNGAGRHVGPGEDSAGGSDDGASTGDDGTDGSDGGGRTLGGTTEDPVGTLGGVVQGTTERVDDVVSGAAETVGGVVDGTTDVADDLLGGTTVSDLADEPADALTDVLGGLLGS